MADVIDKHNDFEDDPFDDEFVYDWDEYDPWSDIWYQVAEDEEDDLDYDRDYKQENYDDEPDLDWLYASNGKVADEIYRSMMMQCRIKGMNCRETRYLEKELYQNIALGEDDNPILMARALNW